MLLWLLIECLLLEFEVITVNESSIFAVITENFSKSKSKIKFKWPLEISPKIGIKEYLEKYLRNSERKIFKKSSEIIKDDFTDNKVEEDLRTKIDEIFEKVKK